MAASKILFSSEMGLPSHVVSRSQRPGCAVGRNQIPAWRQPRVSAIKMPGMKKVGNVTLRKGTFKSDNKFWDWFNQIKMNTIKRLPVTISLLDETGSPTMVWTLTNAWPTKITGTDLKSEGSEVAIETLEIVHEGLTVANS